MAVPGKLIVPLAFDRDDDGELQPAFKPREMRTSVASGRGARDEGPFRRRHRLGVRCRSSSG